MRRLFFLPRSDTTEKKNESTFPRFAPLRIEGELEGEAHRGEENAHNVGLGARSN
jgi:hypothetical protein